MNGTISQRLQSLATKLIGTAQEPTERQWEEHGFDPDSTCLGDAVGATTEDWQAFDAIAMRCPSCDWWCATSELDRHNGVCHECSG